MSQFTKGFTWASGDTVTAERMNQMVEDTEITAEIITDQAAETAIADDDLVLIYDTSASGLRKFTRANLLGLLNANAVHGQTEKTSLVDADEFLIYDSAGTALKRITRANLLSQLQPAGTVLQTVLGATSSLISVTENLPRDTSIPQISEGKQVLTLGITPKSATNKILVRMVMQGATSGGIFNPVMAGFRQGTANAFGAATGQRFDSAGTTIVVEWLDEPATTSAVTYEMRAGTSSGTLYVNGDVNGAQLFGTAGRSTITLMEIKA